MFLIVSRVRGSGSNITQGRIRVVFGELLGGYLSWLSIPFLGLGLCVRMIRSWRLAEGGGVMCGGVINVDVSSGPPSSAASPASVMTPGKAEWVYLQPGLPRQGMILPHDPPLSAVLSLVSDQALINGPLCQT